MMTLEEAERLLMTVQVNDYLFDSSMQELCHHVPWVLLRAQGVLRLYRQSSAQLEFIYTPCGPVAAVQDINVITPRRPAWRCIDVFYPLAQPQKRCNCSRACRCLV
jgi:hypothetical protein